MNDRLHPTFTEPLAPIARAVQRYAVTLTYTDGIYKRHVVAASEKRAIGLAQFDARMASPFNSHSGELLESRAVLEPA